jgi:SAM-dependent methyltransferase
MSDYINSVESAGELARLDHQAGLVIDAIGHLPHALRGRHFQNILDLGCGSGRWALDMAYHYPDAEIVGVDISNTLVEYARARAKTMNRQNVKFLIFDALDGNLGELGRGSYDLVNLRFAVGWVRGLDRWTKLLERCHLLNAPGGYTVVTEGEGLYTDSSALSRLHEMVIQALRLGGYGFPSSGQDLGLAAQLGTLLYSVGFSRVALEGGAIDFSFYNPEENMAWRNSFHALIAETGPFFLKMGVTIAEELAELSVQVGSELYDEAFSGVGSLFTFYGMRVKGKST